MQQYPVLMRSDPVPATQRRKMPPLSEQRTASSSSNNKARSTTNNNDGGDAQPTTTHSNGSIVQQATDSSSALIASRPPADGNMMLRQDPNSKWLNLLYDRGANLRCFSQHMAFHDVRGRGSAQIAVAHIGDGVSRGAAKIVIIGGNGPNEEMPLGSVPVAIASLYSDTHARRVPILAVASGDNIFIYRNLKATYRYRVPALPAEALERQLWTQSRMTPDADADMLHECLRELRDKFEEPQHVLSPMTLAFVEIESSEERRRFVEENRAQPPGRPDSITAMETCKRDSAADESVSCIVFGTEGRNLYVLDASHFAILSRRSMPAVAVLIHAYGLYDVDHRLIVSCRDACIYVYKGGASEVGSTPADQLSQPPQCIPVYCPIVGLARLSKQVVVTCIDGSLRAFKKDRLQWKLQVAQPGAGDSPDLSAIDPYPTCLTAIEYEPSGLSAIVVALSNRLVRVYCDDRLFDQSLAPDVVVAMRFGNFAREEGCLAMITQEGSLIVRMLKRTVRAPSSDAYSSHVDARGAASESKVHNLALPPTSRLFVEQAQRERENYADMYAKFQHDLFEMKLLTQQTYIKASDRRLLLPSSSGEHGSTLSNLEVTSELIGAGPNYVLRLIVRNAAPLGQRPLDGAIVGLRCLLEPDDEQVVRIERHSWNLPIVLAQETTVVRAQLLVSQYGMASQIFVHLMERVEGERGVALPFCGGVESSRVFFTRPIDMPICDGDILDM